MESSGNLPSSGKSAMELEGIGESRAILSEEHFHQLQSEFGYASRNIKKFQKMKYLNPHTGRVILFAVNNFICVDHWKPSFA